MAYTARQLVSESYYLSNVVSRGFETVSGEQLTDGINGLNKVLSWQSVNSDLIPYYKKEALTLVVGQEKYSVAHLLSVDTLFYYLGSVRIPIPVLTRRDYENRCRVEGVNTIPIMAYLERSKGGSDLYIYFPPDQVYTTYYIGKFGLDSVTADTDMTTVYDLFYINYLEYYLAKYLALRNGSEVDVSLEKELEVMKSKINGISNPDYTMRKKNCFSGQNAFGWGDVFIGRGWRPT
jgi:hypothetical protein